MLYGPIELSIKLQLNTPFQLVYRQKTILPIEFEIPSLRNAIEHRLSNVESLQDKLATLESLDEDRRIALFNTFVAQ